VASPASATVINMWRYTSTTQYAFMVWCLMKHRNSFIFTVSNNVYHYDFLMGPSRNR
jgi:hypothetical protein